MLTSKETKVEDLEKQKAQLERKIQDVLKNINNEPILKVLNLHLSNESELNGKVK